MGHVVNHSDRFEYTTEQDPYYNYCLWDYAPIAPTADKFRAINLLLHSFDAAGICGGAYDIVEAIRDAIGMFQTVFGIKFVDGRMAWEFYFYDYARRQRRVSITTVLDAIRPFVRCDVPVKERLPYFMFSLDFDNDIFAGRHDMELVHMYIGNPGSTVSSGIAYAVHADRIILENFYFFFDAEKQLAEIKDKISESVYVDDTEVDLDGILRPELRDCHTICIANKQTHDTIYFSQVNVDQLLCFLRLLRYPHNIISFVDQHRDDLDHLLYDVGFDYTTRGSEIQLIKSGYYGVL